TYFQLRVESWSDSIAAHRAAFAELVRLPPSRFDEVLEKHPRFALREGRDKQLGWCVDLLRQSAVFDTYYQRTLLALALEAVRAERGAYPRELSALTPEWLRTLPTDPVNGMPFQYQSDESGYRLR